jgi:hypothetical protein
MPHPNLDEMIQGRASKGSPLDGLSPYMNKRLLRRLLLTAHLPQMKNDWLPTPKPSTISIKAPA